MSLLLLLFGWCSGGQCQTFFPSKRSWWIATFLVITTLQLWTAFTNTVEGPSETKEAVGGKEEGSTKKSQITWLMQPIFYAICKFCYAPCYTHTCVASIFLQFSFWGRKKIFSKLQIEFWQKNRLYYPSAAAHTRVSNENRSRGFLHFMKLRTVDISKCIKYTLWL